MSDAIVELQTYIIKLSRSGEEGEKAHLVLESGTRFHTTQVRRLALQTQHANCAQTPNFCSFDLYNLLSLPLLSPQKASEQQCCGQN